MQNDNRISKLMLAIAAALLVALVGYSAATAEAAETAASAGSDPWEATGDESAPEDTDRVIGRVVGLRGRVYAQTPGEEKRLLVENAPIFPGDRIVTARGTQLGVLAGEYYTGLGENTTLVYSKRGTGAPQVKLERGDVRVVNAGQGEPAHIETPGIVAAAAGPDTSAYAVEEKAWVVSMVCALEGQVKVVGGGRALVVEEGGCAASQPVAGLFVAGAAPAVLPLADSPPVGAVPGMLRAAEAALPPVGAAGPRFADPVADGPPGTTRLVVDARPAIGSDGNALDVVQPCDRPGSCITQSNVSPVGLTPANTWVGGNLPGQP